jgi:hypothetical protein
LKDNPLLYIGQGFSRVILLFYCKKMEKLCVMKLDLFQISTAILRDFRDFIGGGVFLKMGRQGGV